MIVQLLHQMYITMKDIRLVIQPTETDGKHVQCYLKNTRVKKLEK